MADETTTTQPDWISAAIDRVVDLIGKVRELGTENVIRGARFVVYGLVAFVFAIAALILTVTIMVRLADAYLPIGAGVGDATWAAHLFIGGLLSILGLGLWLTRRTEGSMRWAFMALIADGLIVVAVICYGIIDALT